MSMLKEAKMSSLKNKIENKGEETLPEEGNASEEETSEEETEEAKPARKGRGKGRKNKVRR